MTTVVDCVAYRHGQPQGELALDDISEAVKQDATFVWLGLHEPDLPLLRKIQEEFGLHELAIEDAQSAHQRPKLEEYGDSLFIVLHTARWWDDHMQLGETHIFVGARYFITVRHGASHSYHQVRARCEAMPQHLAAGPGFALYGIMDFVVDHYRPVVDAFEERFSQLEADVFKERSDRQTITRVYQLKRELLKLRNLAAPVIDITNQLMRLHPDLVTRDLRAYYRDVLDHATRVTRTTDSLREMLSDALQVNLALMSLKQNEVVKALASWGAILALPTMVFSMYGMNFRFMPELQSPFGYPLSLLATGLGCAWLYRRFKRAGWL
ncbi:MAG: magnesium/cobalt transporter CorA [Betaproteobacteria bacterium]|nr:magnesium/cobalt transporter CorA [Betaproteobacteria bacterium]